MLLIDRIHKRWILWALRKTNNNVTQAADLLGLSRRTFQNWEIKYRLRAKQTRSIRACAFNKSREQ